VDDVQAAARINDWLEAHARHDSGPTCLVGECFLNNRMVSHICSSAALQLNCTMHTHSPSPSASPASLSLFLDQAAVDRVGESTTIGESVGRALIYLLRVLRWQAFPNLTLDNIAQLARVQIPAVTFAINCPNAKHFFAAVIDVCERAIYVLDGSAENLLNERRSALCQRVVSAVYCALSLLRQVAEKAKRRRGSLSQDTRAWMEPLFRDALPVRPRFVTGAHPTFSLPCGWETLYTDSREIEIRRVRSGAFPAQRDGVSCGVFAAAAITRIMQLASSKGGEVGCSVRDVIDQLLSGSTPWLFSQDDMPVMRLGMLAQLFASWTVDQTYGLIETALTEVYATERPAPVLLLTLFHERTVARVTLDSAFLHASYPPYRQLLEWTGGVRAVRRSVPSVTNAGAGVRGDRASHSDVDDDP
jgi:hypothetical protein